MNEMIERVAEAMHNCIYAEPKVQWSELHEDSRAVVRRIARVAIEAMRDPTDAMTRNGWLAAHRVITADRCNHEMLTKAWHAMIDAALAL